MKISKNEPILKAPSAILFLIGLMVIIHITFTKILSSGLGASLFLNLAFVPNEFSRGDKLWTLISYAFLHGSWEHLIMNMVWLLAFGSAVAKRIESAKIYLLFFLLCCDIAVAAILALIRSCPDRVAKNPASWNAAAIARSSIEWVSRESSVASVSVCWTTSSVWAGQ